MYSPLPTITLALILASLVVPGDAIAQEKSEAQQAWEKLVGERQKDNPAYAYVEDDPALPRVLLIGDSISIGYTPTVRDRLKGKANVHRIPTNGGDTNRGVVSIDAWLGEGKWDVIHFNWGLHDIKRLKDGELDTTADRAVTPATYQANLQKLADRLKQTGAKLIWCATTPVPEGAAGRIPGDEVVYNALAKDIMVALGIEVNDLHAIVSPELDRLQRKANVHFEDVGSEFLGKEVASVIQTALGDTTPKD